MKRNLKLFALVSLSILAGLVLNSDRGHGQGGQQTPIIIKQVSLKNQTTSPTVTLYTPTSSGLYRITVYASVTPSSGNDVCPNVTWTDESGEQSQGIMMGWSNFSSCAFPGPSSGGAVLIVHSEANQPVTFNAGFSGSSEDEYNLFITVEQLQ